MTTGIEWLSAPASLPSEGPAWAGVLREQAAIAFREQGLPTSRQEQWKYTSLKPLALKGLASKDVTDRPAFEPRSACAAAPVRLRLLDGVLTDRQGEVPEGLEIVPLKAALSKDDSTLRQLLQELPTAAPGQSLTDLNTATLGAGVLVRVADGVNAGRVALQCEARPGQDQRLANGRVILQLGQGASLEWVETHPPAEGAGATLNLVVQVTLAENAELAHQRLQDLSVDTALLTRTRVQQAGGSRYRYTGLDLGGRLVRHDVETLLIGEDARADLSGAYLTRGQSHVDNHLSAVHQALGCHSRQWFRGVLDDRSRAVFNSRVHVKPGADGTEALQSNANLLLSRLAEVDTKPELEIEADDVVASHGATVGQLDETAVFYLRSRGIDASTARRMLTAAFCRSVVDRMGEGAVREAFAEALEQALEHIS